MAAHGCSWLLMALFAQGCWLHCFKICSTPNRSQATSKDTADQSIKLMGLRIILLEVSRRAGGMSNYFPLTLKQWKIQKRPPDLQPDRPLHSPAQRSPSPAIHAFSFSARATPRRRAHDLVPSKCASSREIKPEMRTSGGFNPKKNVSRA